ncbi:2Fe-2S iron-sulfur cluster-binding protein [Chryseolinea sp. H1M3-3]|uniref:2Fe-2S iron-sulfur cluster-binding protein n=1 Tax=Chryseolinea sp. H1M3-3 TaxID=3034144 RepID=UPI0023EB2DF9|nr:2Fe-2S iron-sulfur cluster-binding protein [Chryseolinea sp. H1M3-3]
MKLEIVRTSKPTDDSISLYFRKTGILEQYKAGQHALLSFKVNNEPFKRTYSFHTSPQQDKDAGITVRAIVGGLISNYLQSMKGSPEIVLEGVSGEFSIDPHTSNKRHLVMFAAGSGITPIMSILKTILYNEPHSAISLIYTNRSYSTIIFKDALLLLRRLFKERLKVYHILTQEERVPAGFEVFYRGRPSKLIIKKMLKNISDEIPNKVEYFLCGPSSLIKLIEETIYSVDAEAKIYKEHFFLPQEKQEFDFSNLPTREVSVHVKGEEKFLIVRSGKSILQAAIDNSVKLPFSCTEGQCGTCRAQLIRGEVKLRRNHILSEDELKSGQILLCQGFPTSDGIAIKSS